MLATRRKFFLFSLELPLTGLNCLELPLHCLELLGLTGLSEVVTILSGVAGTEFIGETPMKAPETGAPTKTESFRLGSAPWFSAVAAFEMSKNESPGFPLCLAIRRMCAGACGISLIDLGVDAVLANDVIYFCGLYKVYFLQKVTKATKPFDRGCVPRKRQAKLYGDRTRRKPGDRIMAGQNHSDGVVAFCHGSLILSRHDSVGTSLGEGGYEGRDRLGG